MLMNFLVPFGFIVKMDQLLETLVTTMVFVFIGARFQKLFDRWALTRHLAAAARVAATLCGSLHSFTFVVACSIAIHLITIAAAWCCVKAIAAPVSAQARSTTHGC